MLGLINRKIARIEMSQRSLACGHKVGCRSPINSANVLLSVTPIFDGGRKCRMMESLCQVAEECFRAEASFTCAVLGFHVNERILSRRVISGAFQVLSLQPF
jgi:hypothetical protein